MKIISWNLWRRKGAGAGDVAELIAREAPDVVLMQEATAEIDALPELVGGHYVRTPLPGRIHGLASWSRRPFAFPPRRLWLPPGTLIRRVCQLVPLEGVVLANVHLSHGQVLNRRQLRRIAEALPERAAVLGDFNLIGPAWLPGFADVGPRAPTHRAGDVVPLRIDRCLVRGLACVESYILPRGASDHCPIVVRLLPVESERLAA